MPEAADCLVCELPQQRTTEGATHLRYRTICERCGAYEIAPMDGVFTTVLQLQLEQRPIFSHWVYEQNRLGMVPNITAEDIPIISGRRRFSYVERTRLLLSYILENTTSPAQTVDTASLKVQAALQQFDPAYINSIVHYLREEGFLTLIQPFRLGESAHVQLTPRGLMQAEEWGRSNVVSTQGFVAMWFDEQMHPVWEKGFHPAIEAAGYRPHRIDRKEHVNKICDEIIAEIRRSRFVVADFTGQRGGVYYEAGYASGRDTPVIWTCRKDHFENVHFDIRQYNSIVWMTPEELAQRLQVRIEAVIGDGPLKPRV